MPKGRRTPEEDLARQNARMLCKNQGALIGRYREKDAVRVSPCKTWPQGIITAFHGWQETLNRLTLLANRPELITDGFYIAEDEEVEHADHL